MSNDEKSTGKKAGGFSKFKQQYGQIGGGKRQDGEEPESQDIQPSKRLDVQPLEHQTIQESEHQSRRSDIQPLNHQDIQPSESQSRGEADMLNMKPVEHLEVQESRGKQQRDKLTVYLEPDLNDWVRQQAITEKRRRGHHVEISEIINEALRKAKESI